VVGPYAASNDGAALARIPSELLGSDFAATSWPSRESGVLEIWQVLALIAYVHIPADETAPFASELARIEALMYELCSNSINSTLGRLAWEHIATGGKRLRARLAVQMVGASGAHADHGIAWGAACELLHNASLIHDDIEDGDHFRRGQPALWARYGTAQAINAGDLCIALGYAAIAAVPVSDGVRWLLTNAMTRAARRIVEGQAAEFSLLSSGVPSWRAYAECVEGKTAALFALPIEGAALIAGHSSGEALALAHGCRPLGLLFQLQDDILDLFGDNGRDLPGSDLAQSGKASAFVVEHLRLYPGDVDWLMRILTTPREQTSREQIDEAITRFANDGALEAVWQRIDGIRRELSKSHAISHEPALAMLVQEFVDAALRPVEHTRPGITGHHLRMG
jgi:geranylgeranyl diphosphate synthase type I